MTATCQTCRWWTGQTCRRYPPVVVVPGTWTGGTSEHPVNVFPSTHPTNWCGEHQPKQETTDDPT